MKPWTFYFTFKVVDGALFGISPSNSVSNASFASREFRAAWSSIDALDQKATYCLQALESTTAAPQPSSTSENSRLSLTVLLSVIFGVCFGLILLLLVMSYQRFHNQRRQQLLSEAQAEQLQLETQIERTNILLGKLNQHTVTAFER